MGKACSKAKDFVQDHWKDGLKAFKKTLGKYGDDAEDFFNDLGNDICNGITFGHCRHRRSSSRHLLGSSLKDVCRAACDVYYNNPLQNLKCDVNSFANDHFDSVMEFAEDVYDWRQRVQEEAGEPHQ